MRINKHWQLYSFSFTITTLLTLEFRTLSSVKPTVYREFKMFPQEAAQCVSPTPTDSARARACVLGEGWLLLKARSSSLDLPSPQVKETAARTRARLFGSPPHPPSGSRLTINNHTLIREQQQQQLLSPLSAPLHRGASRTRSLQFRMDSFPSLHLYLLTVALL